jgi:putative FmdB family regulatory protein
MPTYDYICEKCDKEFEIFQSMNDPHLKKCPDAECRGKVRRKIGAGAGFVFKGSGFYITDYRSESYKAAAKKDSAPTASDAASSTASGCACAPGESSSKPANSSAKPAKSGAKARKAASS